MKKTLLFVVAPVLLLGACSEHQSTEPHPRVATTKATPEALLPGRWHNNDFEKAGATKQFSPDKGNLRHGRADGFWPLGGHYTVTSTNSAQQTLTLTVKSDPAEGDQPAASFTANLHFATDGKHFTINRISGHGGPSAGLTFDRVH